MGENIILSFLNIDDYIDEEDSKEYFRYIINYLEESNKENDAWKSIIVIHSKLLEEQINGLYYQLSNIRTNDDVLLGMLATNDRYKFFYYDFILTNDVDYRKKEIFESAVYYYKDFTNIKKAIVFDQDLHLKKKDLDEVFRKVPYEVIDFKNEKKLIKKIN